MKLAAFIVLLAVAAASGQLIDPNGAWVDAAPSKIGATFSATLADALAAGYTVPTAEQIAAHEAELAAAASNAAERASLPEVFPNGIAVVDEDGHHVELVPEGQDVVAVQISNSPLDPATRREMKQAAVTAERQRRQEWRDANLALRSSLTNNIADVEAIRDGLTATSTTAQVRSALIATVRELRQAQGDVQERRRMVANMAREDQ